MIIHQSNVQDTRSFYTHLENTHYHMKKIDTYAAKVPIKLQNLDRRTMFREYPPYFKTIPFAKEHIFSCLIYYKLSSLQ